MYGNVGYTHTYFYICILCVSVCMHVCNVCMYVYLVNSRTVFVTHLSILWHSGTEGGRTLVTYFAEEGVFFEDLRMSAIL